MRVCLYSRGYESNIVQEVGRPSQIHGIRAALPYRAPAMQEECSCPAGTLGKSLQPRQACPQEILRYERWKAHRRRDRCCRPKVFLAEAPSHATDGLQPSQLVRVENAADSPCGLTPELSRPATYESVSCGNGTTTHLSQATRRVRLERIVRRALDLAAVPL